MARGKRGGSESLHDPRPYRPCVGVMLINREGLVFVGNRVDTPGQHWQMPQGGIDRGEAPADAALRELKEEAGTDKAEMLGQASRWMAYDLPPKIARRIWKGRYRGQTQLWFAMRFLGTDDDIDLGSHHREFTDYHWAPVDDLVDLIIPFKRHVYQQVVEELGGFAARFKN